jgi:hypothetical protein
MSFQIQTFENHLFRLLTSTTLTNESRNLPPGATGVDNSEANHLVEHCGRSSRAKQGPASNLLNLWRQKSLGCQPKSHCLSQHFCR